MKIILSLLTTLLFSFSIQAQTVANIEIPDSVTINNSKNKLVLNGAGIRTKFIFDIYIGALYLEKKQNNAEAIYKLPGAKKVHMQFLYDESSEEKLVSAWNDGFNSNHSDKELAKIKKQVTQFNNLFTAVKKGDVIDINFIPTKGTSIIINGSNKGTVMGDQFFTAILKIWLGDSPADSDLKRAMLGTVND